MDSDFGRGLPAALGRADELARLTALYDAAVADSRSAFVMVTGQSGVGKSALLDAARSHLRERGALSLCGRCRPGLASYRPLVDVVRGALQHLCEQGQACPQSEHLLDVLGGRLSITAPDDGDRIGLFDELATLLTAASADRPTVLIIHDLDVADPATRQLVLYLARVLTGAPALARSDFRGMIIASATTRERISDDGDRWTDGVNLAELEIGGLNAAGVRAFLSSERVVEQVLEATGGLPRSLDALVSRCSLQDLSPLDKLGPSEQQLLDLLAVFGRPLGPDTLQELTGLPHAELARTISRLMDRRVVEKLVTDGELRVAFCRLCDQQATYDALTRERRQTLHAAVGAHLEGQGRQEDLEAAAHHLLLGSRGGAVEVALTAGLRLETAFCHERAVDLYERARDQADNPDQRREIAERLCALHEATGQLDRALDQAEQLQDLCPQDREIGLRIARIHLRRGDFGAARAALRRIQEDLATAARQAGEPSTARLQARVMAYSAEAHYLAGKVDAALADATSALEHYAGADASVLDIADRRAWINLQNTVGMIHLEAEDWQQARQLFVDNLERARAAGLASEEVRAMIQLGLSHMQQGDLGEAERWYQRTRRLAEQVGEHRFLGACQQHLGVLAERRRDYGRALECYQEAVNVWKKVGHRSYLAWVGLDLAKLYLDLGDVSRAAATLALADRLADSDPPLVTRINLELIRGRIAQHQCRFAEASARYTAAQELAATAGHVDRAHRAGLHQTELLLERGDEMEASRLLAQLGLPPQRGATRLRTLMLCATLHERRGDLESARMELAEALELSDDLRDLESTWEVRLLLAQIADREGRQTEARRLLGEATMIEARVRATVPQELRQLVAEQPRRVALQRAVANLQCKAEEPTREVTPIRAPQVQDRVALPRRRHAEIIGNHKRMRQVLEQIDKVGPTDALVLIRGESGTGKELVADAIHCASPRVKRPLIKVNCGALVENLLLSELFGHERGAFTGATQRRVGRFELADGGTIFLDEIGDISPKTQVALLRVLQDHSFERVGGTARVKVDVRIICATNRDLEQMVANGQFREDLYYRLKGVQIELPPLRQRIEDLPLLAEHFLAAISRERGGAAQTLGPDALQLLCCHSWPGNVRELENVLRSVSLFAEGTVLQQGDFADYSELRVAGAPSPDDAGGAAGGGSGADPVGVGRGIYEELKGQGCSLRELKKRIESECIRHALQEADGNITRAAELLGMKRPRLSQLVKEHAIDVRGGGF